MTQSGVSNTTIIKAQEEQLERVPDLLVTEAPLEIRLIHKNDDQILDSTVTVTMRTPGNDIELVIGFLFAEGIIDSFQAIKSIQYCQKTAPKDQGNRIKVFLNANYEIDISLLDRNFAATSSCGVCGKRSLEQLQTIFPKTHSTDLTIPLATLYSLSEKLNSQQHLFNHTGGLHAAALFDKNGSLLYAREDIGRHNALDKVLGQTLTKSKTLFDTSILFLSSRIGYEIIQKAAMARIPIVVAVGAPSNLAVEIAKKAEITLIGFAKDNSLNIYSGASRIAEAKYLNATKLNTINFVG